ncbi:6-pyruvoyl tetrahydrobiopterin synthase [bacterium]|jgi:6-pyruvoyltetrahydropterin/6-carboxytetrahydropterin synthase|nr:6-pyruvoyl tetrahydrobiopterin synthase [bacterium]MBD97745.1 6-pyruvoyl tetrahydrobiopterin synthase [bacterium]|tara:strand:- start:1146 stop:1571 length:426 start_codon:yes stop_codon:yes gene_type:complete
MLKHPVFLTLRRTFCAAHRLYSDALSPEDNQKIFNKCAHPHGHGHNYVVHVSLRGEPDPTTGMIMNVSILKELLETHVFSDFDHRHLNIDVHEFQAGLLPTVENIAIVIWNRLYPHLPEYLYAIKVEETESISALYYGPES